MTEHDPRAVERVTRELINDKNAYCRHDGEWWIDPEGAAKFVLSREAGLVAAADELRRATINATHALGGAALGTISVPSTLVVRVNVDLTTAVATWHRFLASRQPSEPTLAEAVERAVEQMKRACEWSSAVSGTCQILEDALARERGKAAKP